MDLRIQHVTNPALERLMNFFRSRQTFSGMFGAPLLYASSPWSHSSPILSLLKQFSQHNIYIYEINQFSKIWGILFLLAFLPLIVSGQLQQSSGTKINSGNSHVGRAHQSLLRYADHIDQQVLSNNSTQRIRLSHVMSITVAYLGPAEFLRAQLLIKSMPGQPYISMTLCCEFSRMVIQAIDTHLDLIQGLKLIGTRQFSRSQRCFPSTQGISQLNNNYTDFQKNILNSYNNAELQRDLKKLGLTQQQFLDFAYMFSVGLGVLDNYRTAEKCIRNVSALVLNFGYIAGNLTQSAASVDVYQVYIATTLALGNVSWTYKGCFTATEGSILQLYHHILQYRSLTNYLLYLLPNMLSYAFVVNQWINKMQALEQAKNYTGLAYYYGMIIRNVFFFSIPEAAGIDDTVDVYRKVRYPLESSEDDQDERLLTSIDQDRLRSTLFKGFIKVIDQVSKEEDEESNDTKKRKRKGKDIWENEELLQEDVIDYGQISEEESDEMLQESMKLFQAKLYSLWDYITFGYLTVYWVLTTMWTYNNDSYFANCNKTWVDLINLIEVFIAYLEMPFGTVIKEETFTLVTTLEFPYPISVYCYSAIFEVGQDMGDRLDLFFRRPGKLIENIMNKLGTILSNAMTAPDCLPAFDGKCFGQRLGIAINYVFYP